MNGTFFVKINTLITKCVLISSINFVWKISHCKGKWARYGQKCISVCMYSAGCYCQILIELEFYWVFRKILRYQISLKSLNLDLNFSMSKDGRKGKTKSVFAFRSFAKAPKNEDSLTLNQLTWKIWWAPNNARRWQMGFNWAFKGLMDYRNIFDVCLTCIIHTIT